MNRAERRRQERYLRSAQGLKDIQADRKALSNEKEAYAKVVKKLDAMTQEDVTQVAYKDGYRDGVAECGKKIIFRYFTATIMALHELYGFGQDRCLRTLRKIDDCIVQHLTDDELVEATKKLVGIEIDMEEGINRAQPM